MKNQQEIALHQPLSANPVQGDLIAAPSVYISATDLTPKQEAFALAYVETGNVAAAYREAYDMGPLTAAQTARTNGHKVLAHPKVAARVRAIRAALGEAPLMTPTDLVADLEAIVNADPAELMAVTVVNCRYCHGDAHGFQFRDDAELARAVTEYMAALGSPKPIPAPDLTGGFGFRPDRPPADDCPRCDGAGETVVRLNDTTEASPGARRLIRGLELHSDGTIKRLHLHDQLAARQELHRLKGMLVDRSVLLTAKVDVPTPKDMTPEQQADFIRSLGMQPA